MYNLYFVLDISLIKNNAKVAAQISVELSKMRSDNYSPNRKTETHVDKKSPVNN